MPKKCSEENCNWVVFSKGLCKFHWGKSYGKPIKKQSDKGVIKKEFKRKLIEEDKQFYLKVWNSGAHICENCSKYLSEPLLQYFHHSLYKAIFPQYRHAKWNIMLLCSDCHNQTHTDASKVPFIEQRRLQLLKFIEDDQNCEEV